MAKRSRRARVGSSKANALITPGRRIPASKAIAGIERLNDQVVRQLRREAVERQRFARESTRAMAPMIKLLQQDKVAMAAHRNLQKLTTRRAAPKARFPDVLQRLENEVRAGSILSIIGAPYDFEWGAEGPRNGTTWGTYVSYKSGSDPRFNSNVNIGAGGSSWASGGLGKQFVPAGANTTWVRIGLYAPTEFSWRVSSTLATAHARAFIGVFVQSFDLQGGDPRTEVDRRNWLFAEGSSWYQDHSGGDTTYFPSDTYFMASSARIYIVWAWCHASADGYQGAVTSSYASSYVGTRLPFMVFEQWT